MGMTPRCLIPGNVMKTVRMKQQCADIGAYADITNAHTAHNTMKKRDIYLQLYL